MVPTHELKHATITRSTKRKLEGDSQTENFQHS